MAQENPFAEFDAANGINTTGAFDGFDEQIKQERLERAVDVPGVEDGEAEGRSLGEAVADFVVTPALKGTMGLTDSIIGLADIPTGGRVGKFLEETGYNPNVTREGLDEHVISDEQREANAAFEEAEGFVDSTKAALENPSVILNAVTESAPQIVSGGLAAKGIVKAAPKISGAVAAGAGEGLMSAGSSAEGQRQESEDGKLNSKQTLAAVTSGVNTALLGAFGAKIANKLGVKDVDSILTGAAGKAKTSFPKALVSGGITEGVFEELPQSVQEQMLTNWANDKPITEGVDKAASLGMLSGAAMGASVQAVKAPLSTADEIRAKSKKVKEKIAEKKKQKAQPNTDNDLLAQVQEATDTPTPEAPETLAAQAEAVNDGRKSAMLVTEGEQIPDNIDPEAKAVDTNRGTVIYKDEAVADTLANEGVGAALDYGIDEKPEGATEVVTARDGNGTVIQDALTDGSPSTIEAAQKVAGENGSVEVRSAQEALAERQQNTDPVSQVFNQKIADIESRGYNPLDPVKKQLGYSDAFDYYKALEKVKNLDLPVAERQAALEVINNIESKLNAEQQPISDEIVQVSENLYQLKGRPLRNPDTNQYEPAYNNDGDLVGWKPKGETNVSTNVTNAAGVATEPSGTEISDASPSDGNMVSDVSGTARNSDNAATPQSSDGNDLRNGVVGDGAGDRTGLEREDSALDAKANEAATSPQNDLDEPSQAQKEAGNYKLGRVKVGGLDISVENPDQSLRKGTDPDGNEWQSTMHGHYGYVKGVPARGNDKDHVDVNIKPSTAEDYDGDVYVINQVDPKTGRFDEHKVYIGYNNETEAREAYQSNYEDGWQGLDSVATLSMDQFKEKLQDTNAFTKPFETETPITQDEVNLLDADKVDQLLKEAGHDTGSDQQTQIVTETTADSNAVSSETTETKTQNEVARTPRSNERPEARPVVESIVKMRRSAQELGKLNQFNSYLDKAKAFLNGEDVKPSSFKTAVRTFKKLDPDISAEYQKLADMAQGQQDSSSYQALSSQIENANDVNSLTKLAQKIQGDSTISEEQAETLDDAIMAKLDGLSNGDHLGDDTAKKQAIADAEIAKDEARNNGVDDQDEFKLTGSSRDADVANASGAQELFDQQSNLGQENDDSKGKQNIPDQSSKATRDDGSEKSESTESVTPIEDFGEKLAGARKDLKSTMSKEVSDDEIANQPLSKIWPKIDPNTIQDPFVAALEYLARREIPNKPRQSYRKKQWVNKVKIMRQLVQFSLENEQYRDRVKDKLLQDVGLGKFVDQIQFFESLPREHWHRVRSVEYYSDAKRHTKDGEFEPNPQSGLYIDDRWRYVEGASTREELLPKVVEILESKEDDSLDKNKKLKFEIRKWRGEKPYRINKKGDKGRAALASFDDINQARDYLANNHGDLVEAWEAHKDRFNVSKADMRRSENRKRTGQDYRKGKDVTPEEFQERFGFRGVQFGNWVNSKNRERQTSLNEAYDALSDLANILDIPTRAISLEGRLGLAFGARGKGKASAHYEPDQLVINLTKTKGAGSLAHEWFHALDNYFAHKRGKLSWEDSKFSNQAYREGNYITYKPEPMMVNKRYATKPLTKIQLKERIKQHGDRGLYKSDDWIIDPDYKEGVRPEVELKFSNLVNKLDESNFTLRSKKLDKSDKGDGYWGRVIERGARAFESYIVTQMQEGGYHNDYLANIASEDVFKRDSSRYPYVTAEEMPPIKEAFDALFETIESKETDDGNVALFSRTQSSSTPIFYSQLSSAIGEAKQDNWKGKAWAQWLTSNAPKLGVKKDEIEWSGITDYFELNKDNKISKADIQQYLDENGVQIEEVTKGGLAAIPFYEDLPRDVQQIIDDVETGNITASEARKRAKAKGYELDIGMDGEVAEIREIDSKYSSPPKFRDYIVKGGENYKELLLKLPSGYRVEVTQPDGRVDIDNTVYQNKSEANKVVEDFSQRFPDTKYKLVPNNKDGYKSSHWDETNILAHVRFDERTDADGNKVLFIQEIQSDFGQDFKKTKDAINKAVDNDFNEIVERMKSAGVLEVNCD